MKICKYCMSEIDEKAKICPHCRKKQRNKKTKKELLILIGIFFVIGLIFSFNNDNFENENENSLKDIFEDNFTVTYISGTVEQYGNATINGKVTNNKDRRFNNVTITYNIYDSNRAKIGVASTTIQYIEANETIDFTATGVSKYVDGATIELESIKND